jgi:methyl-accepting chemotaxis protein
VQQNAASSEELASTAEELSSQAAQSLDTVGYFRLARESRTRPGVAVKKAPTAIALAPASGDKDSDFEEF